MKVVLWIVALLVLGLCAAALYTLNRPTLSPRKFPAVPAEKSLDYESFLNLKRGEPIAIPKKPGENLTIGEMRQMILFITIINAQPAPEGQVAATNAVEASRQRDKLAQCFAKMGTLPGERALSFDEDVLSRDEIQQVLLAYLTASDQYQAQGAIEITPEGNKAIEDLIQQAIQVYDLPNQPFKK